MDRAEKIGLGIATGGHVLLFAALSASLLRTPEPLRLKNNPLDVTLVDEVALQSAAPRIAVEPPPSAQAPEKGPAEEARPAPAPAPAPVPPPPPKAAPKPQPAPKPLPKPKPVEKAKPLPKAAAPADKPAPRKPSETRPATPAKSVKTVTPVAPSASKLSTKATPKAASGSGTAQTSRASRLGPDFLKGIAAETPARPSPKPAAEGAPAEKMSAIQVARLNEAISQQIYPHLRLPSGADVEMLVASLDVKLAKDGSVIGRPAVLSVTGQTDSNRPQVNLYKERAVQAVLAASPFRNLPPEYHEQWRWLSPLRIYARKAQ